MKNQSAQALNAIRWGRKTDEEKKAHTKMMRDAKERKNKPDENKQT